MNYAIPLPTSKGNHCAPFHHTMPSDQIEKNQTNLKPTLLPEWAMLECVQLTWPHEGTDWAYMLDEVTECYLQLVYHITLRTKLIIVAPDTEKVNEVLTQRIPESLRENIQLVACPTNDTWARDHGFLTCVQPSQDGTLRRLFLDFRFNGWGGKFEASLDNQINKHLHSAGILKGEYIDHLDFELEGGSIESDGNGTILTTSTCLLNPNRNPQYSKTEIEAMLKEWFGAKQVLWLNNGYLAGDDTDSHIDTLARLCPMNTILYVKCDDENDEHYPALHAMEEELKAMRTLEGEPYRLIPLPMAQPAFDDEGCRLPATYANYLVLNDCVLYPTYNDTYNDHKALVAIAKAFPNYELAAIDCSALIHQHGSLHCATMQYPRI